MELSIIMSDPERVPFKILTVHTYNLTWPKRNMNGPVSLLAAFGENSPEYHRDFCIGVLRPHLFIASDGIKY